MKNKALAIGAAFILAAVAAFSFTGSDNCCAAAGAQNGNCNAQAQTCCGIPCPAGDSCPVPCCE